MPYTVLARKWRPQTFDQVVGQTTVTRTLKNALASGRIGHAFLLSGPRGVGKTTTARVLAKALNCAKGDGPGPEPCGQCSSCQEIAAGTSMDVQEIDGATHNGVEQVRELRESARYNPARDRFKIWIIDEVHMLSTGAFNALLKTLEEPPPRVKFVFATTEYHKIPDTIVSRCQQYDFRLIPARELQAHLREVATGETVTVSDETLGRIARAAEGSVRDALSLFDQVLSFSGQEVRDEDVSALLGLIDRELLLAVSQAVAAGDSLALLEAVERLADHGVDYRNFVRELLLHFREVLLLKLAPPGSALLASLPPEERDRLRPLGAAYSEEDLLRVVEVLTDADTELRLAQDPRVTVELALLKLVQLRRLLPFADLVDRVERMAQGSAVAAPRAVAPVAATPARAAAPATATGPPPPRTAPPPTAPPPGSAGSLPAPAGPTDLLGALAAQAQARPSLAQPLRGAQVREEGDAVVLEVQPDFYRLAESHLDEYLDLLRKVSGRPRKVRIVPAEAPVAAAAPSPAEEQRRRTRDEAVGEPAVQEALDLFGGRVVDVRDSKLS
jgi:DNA polymerase-3 subunit gamma/tau